jgi:hypothetical protein
MFCPLADSEIPPFPAPHTSAWTMAWMCQVLLHTPRSYPCQSCLGRLDPSQPSDQVRIIENRKDGVARDPVIAIQFEILMHHTLIHRLEHSARYLAGPGTQYRSAIFTHRPEQQAAAGEVIRGLTEEKIWDRPIVTEVTPLTVFYPAEEYHREYFARHPGQGYCQMVIAPK